MIRLRNGEEVDTVNASQQWATLWTGRGTWPMTKREEIVSENTHIHLVSTFSRRLCTAIWCISVHRS